MLDESTRTAILRLHQAGRSARGIARAIGISRQAVKSVIASGSAMVPEIERPSKIEEHREDILHLYASCKGNLIRVHEELQAKGATFSYQALTAFCRLHEIGRTPPKPSGRYHFAPGQEMQHDTSPHDVMIGGKLVRAQTASLVFCYSRMRYVQLYPRFTRIICKFFMTDALAYFDGACGTCMIDNTNVVVLRGTGAAMLPVPEMASFGERYGFEWKAHEKGDANRSAHVERGFDHVDNNFLAGRQFATWEEANEAAKLWCDKVNAKYRRELSATAREVFAAERRFMQPMPAWVPPVYDLHHRIVDSEGYVQVHGTRYSAPWKLIGKKLEVRETKAQIELYDGPRCVGVHERTWQHLKDRRHVSLPEHRPPRGERVPQTPTAAETALLLAGPHMTGYLDGIKKRERGRSAIAMRKLARMMADYPRQAFVAALEAAAQYGLFDLERVERLILRNVARDFFPNVMREKEPDHE